MDYCWLEPEHQDERVRSRPHDLASDTILLCWANALDARAQLPEGFTKRTAELAVDLAKHLRLSRSEAEQIYRGALLHDIGMMQVPDSILRKPGPLTPGEWAMVRLHPFFADEILAPMGILHTTALVPRYHHERWDGEGYPYGLRGEQIPLAVRVFAVVSAWKAMSTDRPYRRALAPEDARNQIARAAGGAFDPEITAAFLARIDQRVQTS